MSGEEDAWVQMLNEVTLQSTWTRKTWLLSIITCCPNGVRGPALFIYNSTLSLHESHEISSCVSGNDD